MGGTCVLDCIKVHSTYIHLFKNIQLRSNALSLHSRLALGRNSAHSLISISSRYYHRNLQRLINKYKCNHCQCYKLDGKGHGHLPQHEICLMPFEECAVDLIRPWTIQVQDKPYEFYALIMIGNASNLVELVRINYKTLAHIARK